MEDKKISILGCGWLGFPLAVYLNKKGYSIKGSTTRHEKLRILEKGGITPFLMTIDDKKIIGEPKLFLDSDILILNIPPKRIPNIVEFYDGQMNLILKQLDNSPVKFVIFISSTSVYQKTNTLVDESTQPIPEKESGKALFQAENKFQTRQNFSTTIIRFAGLIGEDRNPGNFLAGKKNLSGGMNQVNLIHMDDCIGIIEAIIEQECTDELFNGCHPDHPSRKKYYVKMARKMGLKPPTFNNLPDNDFKIVSGKKVEEVLNYRYRVNI